MKTLIMSVIGFLCAFVAVRAVMKQPNQKAMKNLLVSRANMIRAINNHISDVVVLVTRNRKYPIPQSVHIGVTHLKQGLMNITITDVDAYESYSLVRSNLGDKIPSWLENNDERIEALYMDITRPESQPIYPN